MKVWRCSEIMLLLLLAAHRGSAAPLKAVGELSQTRGQITISSGTQPRPRSVARFALLHDGDIVIVAAASSARVKMDDSKKCYSLLGVSRVRVLNGHLLSLSGPSPRSLTASMVAEVLPAGLFDRGREAEQVRGGEQGGPINLSSLFVVQGPGVTLRWDGPTHADDTESAETTLRVRVKETGASQWAFTRSLPMVARSVSIPAGVLVPGHWYSWSVQMVGPGDLSSAGGPLRLLTSDECKELAEIEHEIKYEYPGSREAAKADQARAEACASFGLFEDALQAYQDALHAGGGPACAPAIQRLNLLLKGSLAASAKE